MSLPPPYETLTPDCLLTAVENLGLPASGSLLALNSYENRVYQLGMDDAPPLVVKFYRPARWTDAQIIEEHDFVAALAAEEIPVVPHCPARQTAGCRTTPSSAPAPGWHW